MKTKRTLGQRELEQHVDRGVLLYKNWQKKDRNSKGHIMVVGNIVYAEGEGEEGYYVKTIIASERAREIYKKERVPIEHGDKITFMEEWLKPDREYFFEDESD